MSAPRQFWTDERDKEFRNIRAGWQATGPSIFFSGSLTAKVEQDFLEDVKNEGLRINHPHTTLTDY